MRRIGLITTNKVLAQSLSGALKVRPELDFESYPLLNPNQIALDAEVLKIDIALVDVVNNKVGEDVLSLCRVIRQSVPACRILMLMAQGDNTGKALAIKAIQEKAADDFVFSDASLEYLFAKLSAF